MNKILKNEYFKIAVGLFLGIILLFFFKENKGISGIFEIIGFFLILINLIRIIDVFNGKKSDFKNEIKGIVLVSLLGLFFGIVTNEFIHLENTLNGSKIFKEFGFYGLVFAIFFFILEYSLKPKENRKFNLTGLFSSIIIFPLLFISCGTFINRYKAEKITKPIKSIVLKKEREIDDKSEKNSQFWILTNVGFYSEKFKVKSELWNKLQINDTVLLFIEKGNLGYEIVERIE